MIGRNGLELEGGRCKGGVGRSTEVVGAGEEWIGVRRLWS